MLYCSVLRVNLRHCATCACNVDTLYMHLIPKHAQRAQSQVQRSRLLSNCASSAAQDVGTRNHTVMYMYDVHFGVRT